MINDPAHTYLNEPAPCSPRSVGESLSALQSTVKMLQADLLACQRRALLADLAAIAVHEFNNLLTPIVTRCEAALTSNDAADARKALERSFVLAQRAVAVNQHLLSLARNQPMRWSICSLATTVHEAVDTFPRPLEKDSIELRVEVADDLQVWACEPLLCQVLLNLILNAHRAMKGKAGVNALSIRAAPDGDYVQIDVCDTGVGFPRERIEQDINPFLACPASRRPSEWQPGGLGLNACRLITHLHGAEMRALPNDARGVTFRLRWPTREPQRKTDA